jgi:flagellar biosynthesis protein FlhG
MRDFREQNYYELLDVKPHASAQELERSYQRARRYFSGDSVATYALFQPDELTLLRRRIDEDQERPVPVEQAQTTMFEPVREIMPEEEAEEEPPRRAPPLEVIEEDLLETQEISEPPVEIESIEDRIIREEGENVPPVVAADQSPKPQLPPMPEITEETEYTGDLLRQVREARGLTIEQMANTTKIAIYYLRHLEAEEFEDLPAKVYVRGYLKQIAKLLRLEVEPMVRSFMDRIERPREE